MKSGLGLLVLIGFTALAASFPSPQSTTQRSSRARHSRKSSSAVSVSASETDFLPQTNDRKVVAAAGVLPSSVRGLSRKHQRTTGAGSASASINNKPMEQWTDDDWNRALDERFKPIAPDSPSNQIPDASTLQQIVREQKEAAEANVPEDLQRGALNWAWEGANDFCKRMLDEGHMVRILSNLN